MKEAYKKLRELYLHAYLGDYKPKVTKEAKRIDRSRSWIIRKGLDLYFNQKQK